MGRLVLEGRDMEGIESTHMIPVYHQFLKISSHSHLRVDFFGCTDMGRSFLTMAATCSTAGLAGGLELLPAAGSAVGTLRLCCGCSHFGARDIASFRASDGVGVFLCPVCVEAVFKNSEPGLVHIDMTSMQG